MAQFTVKTAESEYLDNLELTNELAHFCGAPSDPQPGVLGIELDFHFKDRDRLPYCPSPTRILMRTAPGRIRNTPWFYVASDPLLSPHLQALAASFTLAVGDRDFTLHSLLADMHEASPDRESGYSILLGNGCGYVRRMNASEGDAYMRADIHRTDADIQGYIDSQYLVLVPASGSHHERLSAAQRGAALGAIAYTLNHPQTHHQITPVPSMARSAMTSDRLAT